MQFDLSARRCTIAGNHKNKKIVSGSIDKEIPSPNCSTSFGGLS
jgi:hypothetical protein